mgnify:CR=1 FL=1|jgi:hypothetical protein
MIPDLGILEIWDKDTILFRCGCHMLIWEPKNFDRTHAVRLDCCGTRDHFDTLLELVDPATVRWANERDLMICLDVE